MPGYQPNSGGQGYEKMPNDTWLRLALLNANKTTDYIVQLHTSFMPEETQGVWGHAITTPKGKHTWTACPPDGCPLHEHNKAVGKKSPYYFPPRCMGFAIASKLAVKVDGKWQWLPTPETGLLEKGGDFWRTLNAAEYAAANPDEFKGEDALPQDWTQWFIILECDKSGVKATALDPQKTGRPLMELEPERMAYYLDLYQKRITPWPDLEGLLERTAGRGIAQQAVAEGNETAAAKPAAKPRAYAAPTADENLDNIPFDDEPPPAPQPAPAAKPKAPFGKPVSDLVGNVEVDPETAKAIVSAYAELDTMKTYQLLTKLEQLYRRYYGQQYAFAVPKHLKKLGKASVKDFTDEELRDEIVDFETRAKAQEA